MYKVKKAATIAAKDDNKYNLENMVSNTFETEIRFEDTTRSRIWVNPDKILFIKSADHYVRSLILHDTQLKWTIRHSTIKDLLRVLPDRNFIRLNKFYVLNRKEFSHMDEKEKKLYLRNGYSIPIPHRISRFIIEVLNSDYT